MKKTLKRLLCGVLTAGVLASASMAMAYPAKVTDHQASEALSAFIDAGYLKGYEDGTYRSENNVTRAEFATLVNRITLYQDKSADISRYTDVAKNAWYHNALAIALGAGYMRGTTNSTMEPDSNITLEWACTSLARILGLDATNAVSAMSSAGYLVNVGVQSPNAQLTRAQVVTLLYNARLQLAGKGLSADVKTVYGTADLKYADFYAGDVTTTEHYDAITSATNSKSSIMSGIYSDFADAETNADGYHIFGVKDVNVAVAAKDYAAYKAINPSFTVTGFTAPKQYKSVTVSGGKATYSATTYNVADTVTDAAYALQTGSVWGDYQINVYDPEGTSYLRNTRGDEGFAINSRIQGIILETKSGLKVGMEYLQSIWVQPYEVSFNVASINTHNTHIAQWDNLAELTKLLGETVTKITYIMPDETYVYEFDGIYIKPVYEKPVTGVFSADFDAFTFSALPEGLKDAKVTVNFTVGTGRSRTNYALYEGDLADVLKLDRSVIPEGSEGTWSVTVASSNYADITVSFPMTAEQKAQLESLIKQAEAHLKDASIKEHYDEAMALLADSNATSAEAAELISELTSHLQSSQGGQGGQGNQGGAHH